MQNIVYAAKGVSTSIAYGKPDFAIKQYRTFLADHLITILSVVGDRVEWKNEIAFDALGNPEKYTIYGVGFVRKENGRNKYILNGSGSYSLKISQGPDITVITFFSAYQELIGEECKSGNVKFILKENGTTQKILLNGEEIDDYDTYSLTSSFCGKLIPQ